jgi:hypothetical protein
MPEEYSEIIKPMDQSIFQNTYPIAQEILDLDFDELIKSNVVEIIPILRAVTILYKGILGVRDRFFMKKVVLFISHFNSGLDTVEIQKFVSDVLTDEKFRGKVNEKILILLDRYDNECKALILAELLKNWVQRRINWETFKRIAYSVDRTHPSLFFGLYDYYKNFRSPESTCDQKIGGGFYYGFYSMLLGSGLGDITSPSGLHNRYQDALDLCQFGLKGLIDDQYITTPCDIIEFLESMKHEENHGLTHPSFSDYERWLVFMCTVPNANFKIRKEITDKIRKYYLT